MLNPSKEQEEKWAEDRRYYFARWCWVHQHETVQCSDNKWRTWEQVFLRNEGMNLDTYAKMKQAEQKQRLHEEKNETHSKQEGDQMTLL
jgi:hypothetical protein